MARELLGGLELEALDAAEDVVLGQVDELDRQLVLAARVRQAHVDREGIEGHGELAGEHVGEDPDATRKDETIGYVVFEAGSGSTALSPT